MLLGGDLGLLFSVVVVVVGWLLGRWKWRRVASRREEIKRLMTLASEEAARAELEAAAGYRSYGSALATEPVVEEPLIGLGSSPGRQLQFQCEVCFSPTTTRCKQCKAVRYCSRKCQIFHWRQGHKDECHSFSTYQNIDAGVPSRVKEFKQDKIQSSKNVTGIEVMDTAKEVESSSVEHMFSEKVSHVLGENNDAETETSEDCEKTERNIKAPVQSLPDECSSATISNDMSVALDSNLKDGIRYDSQNTSMNVESIKPLLSEQPSVTNPGYGVAAFSVSDELKTGCIDTDEKSESSTSSGSNVTGSEEHSLSEPSSPSSDFLCGTVEPIKSKINAHAFDDVMLNSRSTFHPSSERINVHVEMSGPSMNRVLADGPSQATLTGDRLAPKQLDHEIGGMNGISDTLKCQQNDSSRLRSSEARLPSTACARKPAILETQSVENNSVYVRSAVSGTNPSTRVVDQLKPSCFVRHGSLGSRTGIMGRYEGSFPYEVFVKLYHWNNVELCPCGLINCGNSCYANAVLQCLAFTPPLTAYFLQGRHAKSCQRKEWCFTCEFEALVKKAMVSNYPLSPARIMSQMQRVASHLGNGREEDAHEFLRYAIDAMLSVCLKESGANVPSSFDEETTLLGLTFGGYLQSKIECLRCRGISRQQERIMDLTVEIGGEIATLEDALRQFTQSEILDGENKYQCGRCKSYEKAKKKLRVLEAPNVLTIALKRFQSGKFGKLNKAVQFPEILNLASYMSGTSDKSPIYQLYGVLVHLDVMNSTFSGHYVCYIKNNQGRWFKADDSMVQAVELEKVLSNDAYMLFYARCSPRAPRLIRRSSIAIRDPIKSTSKFISHPTEPWELTGPTSNGDFNRNYMNYHPKKSNSEDSSSESSSIFSESESHSTESSNRESVSTTDDFYDHTDCWNRQWRSNSDSDTASPSSSSSSPLCTRRSPLAELDRYSSDADENCSSCYVNVSSKRDGDGFWDGKVDVSNKESSRACSNSCRENEINRLGRNKSCDNVKGVYLR